MTKHNERFPDDPESAMRSALRELLAKIRDAETIDDVDALSRMIQDTADGTPPGPHQLILMHAQRVTTSTRLRMAVTQEMPDG